MKVLAVGPFNLRELLTEVHEGSPLEVKPLAGVKNQRPHGGLSKGAPFESPPWGRCSHPNSSPQKPSCSVETLTVALGGLKAHSYGQHLQRRPPSRRSSLKVLAVEPFNLRELLTEVHEGSPLEVKPLAGVKNQRPHGGLSKGAPFESPPWGRYSTPITSPPETLVTRKKL